jgi:hypothetical protein
MTEAECYARCYAAPRRIAVVRKPSERPELVATVSGEQLRRQFEQRLDSREREAA